jgi:hypothetical protein
MTFGCFSSAAVLVIFFISLAAGTPPRALAQEGGATQEPQSLEQQWGIKVSAIRLTASGYLLDFRYRVIDSTKASDVLKRGQQSYAIHEASGKKLPVTNSKLGPMRQTAVKPLANHTYFVMFSNPATLVKKGDQVTVVIGDFKAEHLTVE